MEKESNIDYLIGLLKRMKKSGAKINLVSVDYGYGVSYVDGWNYQWCEPKEPNGDFVITAHGSGLNKENGKQNNKEK